MSELGGCQGFEGFFEHAQRQRGIAFLRNQFGGVIGREFVDEEEIGDGEHIAAAAGCAPGSAA